MKYFFLFLIFFFFLNLQAQERILVDGQVKNDSSQLENVHIRNISTGKFSVSGENGIFQLNMKSGDTLVLSHVGMQDLIAFIKEEDILKKPMIFNMAENSMELNEVLVREDSEINAVSLGIIPKKIEKLSVNERRLQTAGDFKPRSLLGIIGGGVSIDAILNAINGRTKKLKRNVKIEEQQRHINFLEIHYIDYMQKEMELSQQETKLLINEVIEDEELAGVIASGNEAQMQIFLQDRWIKLQERMKSVEQ